MAGFFRFSTLFLFNILQNETAITLNNIEKIG